MPFLTRDDLKIALRDLTGIFQVVAVVMLIPILVTFYYAQSHNAVFLIKKISVFLVPSLIYFVLYRLFKRYLHSDKSTETKHALLTVVFAWIFIALIGMLPFMLRGTLGPVDSFFESMSGWATTGMTMIEYPEALRGGNEDILFYRSLTHLVGGVGIILFALMVFMHSGTAAISYYSSEVGGERIRPGIKNTVFETWKIYLLYAFAGIVLLYLAGMSPFDAINHSFAAIATGGFSTHSESIAYFDSPLIEIVIMFLMLAGSISFLVHYRVFEGKFSYFYKNIETRYMFILILFSTSILFFYFISQESIVGVNTRSVLDIVRKGSFQVVSAISSTGFSTVNAGDWPPLAQYVLMILMYIGGFYGSTTGGIKLLRLAVVIAAISHTVRKMMLPKTAIVSMKISGKVITNDEVLYVLALSMIWLIIAIAGSMVMMALSYGPLDSMSVALSAMGNVGIVYITGDPWFHMPVIGKLTLTLLMWVGRLEIFPILILIRHIFERRN